MKDRSFVIRVPIKPKTMPRPRGKQGQQAYYPQDYQDWRDAAGWLLRQAINRIRPGLHFEGPVRMAIALFADSATIWISELADGDRQKLTGDVDNYAKAYLDVCKDVGLLADDDQVLDLRVGFGGGDDGTLRDDG